MIKGLLALVADWNEPVITRQRLQKPEGKDSHEA
ncbi:hypothetical protein KPHES18084_15360 [Corynebacterium ulcerans]|nr:hypothetical protein CULTSU28_16430 [Corynebacterium ulcerans]